MFFLFVYIAFSILASIESGSGGIAVVQLTAPMTATSGGGQTISVTTTNDFISVPTGNDRFLVVDDEIVKYTGVNVAHTQFTGVTRGQPDPKIKGAAASTVATHSTGTKITTLSAAAINSAMGSSITASSTGFGAVFSLNFLGSLFTNIPKFVTMDYPFFASGPIVYFKYIVMYPLAIGFVVTMTAGFLVMAFGLIKSLIP